MSGSNSAAFSEVSDLTDDDAVRLAQQIATDRMLPISTRHYEAHLQRRRLNEPYDRKGLDAVMPMLVDEAVIEVQTYRNRALIAKLIAKANLALANRYGLTEDELSLPDQVPATHR